MMGRWSKVRPKFEGTMNSSCVNQGIFLNNFSCAEVDLLNSRKGEHIYALRSCSIPDTKGDCLIIRSRQLKENHLNPGVKFGFLTLILVLKNQLNNRMINKIYISA